MRKVLRKSYRWYERSEDGILRKPKDQWGDSHQLSQEYQSPDLAVEDYCRYVNMEGMPDYPQQMILVEEHTVDIDWDE